jgi:hypothetical protein
MQTLDTVRVIEVPQLRRFARHEAHAEEVAAGGTIGEQIGALGQ